MRAFHKFVAKQVEQRCLEWQDSKAINDQAATFFRHSDLRSAASHIEVPHQALTTNSRSSSSTTSPSQPVFKPSTGPKACKAWNYTGACDCDKQDSTIYSEHHCCRVCKADVVRNAALQFWHSDSQLYQIPIHSPLRPGTDKDMILSIFQQWCDIYLPRVMLNQMPLALRL